jgi:hypothetical protein
MQHLPSVFNTDSITTGKKMNQNRGFWFTAKGYPKLPVWQA